MSIGLPERYLPIVDGMNKLSHGAIPRLIDVDDQACSAVLIIGLDRFKAVNETMGYLIGDEVLRLAGERLRSAIRREDKVVRLPGDEFAILLLEELSWHDIRRLTHRLHELTQRTYLIRGDMVNINTTIGVAFAGQTEVLSDALIRRAAIALRFAKSSNPGTLQFFKQAMEDRAVMRHSLKLELRKALPLRQLELHFQPQVELKTKCLTGFEALLRWRHPDLGWIPPAEFIPIAEETGLISKIGEWVLQTACERIAQIPEGLVMAVNASPLQFANGSFCQVVDQALSKTGVAPRRIEIEITEGVLLKNENTMVQTLSDLGSMGVRLAMDDFGSGYSSLGQLARLPFDKLKIDRSLVGGDVKQRSIIRAIATLGSGVGMSTLLEGIETEEQLAQATSDGCVYGQGYLFGKPVPASELSAVIAQLSPSSPNDGALSVLTGTGHNFPLQ